MVHFIKSSQGYTLFQVGHYSYEIVKAPSCKRVQALNTDFDNAVQYFDRFVAAPVPKGI